MNFQSARKLQIEISEKFLFRRQNQLAYSGGWDDEPSGNDLVYEIFEDVFGVSISGTNDSDYCISLLTSNDDLYLTPVLENFEVELGDIVTHITTPFELRQRKRPLEMGCSVSHRLNNIKGTLGGFVKDKDGQTYILSNHHILYNGDDIKDNFIVQPCALTAGSDAKNAIGLYSRSLAYFPSDINKYDAAIAGPISVDIEYKVPEVGKAIKSTSEPENERIVYKIGAASGRTFGKISGFLTNVRVRIDGQRYDFADQVLIEGLDSDLVSSASFSEPGDSGSLVIDYESHKAVGLLFAGNENGVTLANPLTSVLRELGVGF